jgi:hypothetical protein
MRRAVLVTLLLAVPALLPAQGLGVTAAIFRQFLVDYWDWRLADEPELATHVGVDTYDHRWRDWSTAARTRAREARQEFLQRLVYIATGTLSTPERLSADLLMDELRAGLDAEPWLALVGRLSPARGAHHEVFDTIAQMPARDVDDYERLLARLRALPAWADQQIELLRRQLALGFAQPVDAVDAVIAQIEAQRGESADRTPLLAAFRAFPAAIPEAAQGPAARRGAGRVGRTGGVGLGRARDLPARRIPARRAAGARHRHVARRRARLSRARPCLHRYVTRTGGDPCAGPRGGGAHRTRDAARHSRGR